MFACLSLQGSQCGEGEQDHPRGQEERPQHSPAQPSQKPLERFHRFLSAVRQQQFLEFLQHLGGLPCLPCGGFLLSCGVFGGLVNLCFLPGFRLHAF